VFFVNKKITMNKITEKLSVALEQLNELRTRYSPLGDRVDVLNQKVGLISQSVLELANEIAELKSITNSSANVFDSVTGILSEIEAESVQICRNIEENEVLRESMTSMFGEAFNVVSKFIDTAKHIGIIDNNRANQILEGKSINSATENPTSEINDTNNPNSTNVIEDTGIALNSATETVTETVTEAETETEVISALSADNADDLLPSEISGNITQTETIGDNDLTATEMASQLDLQPLQFNTLTEITTAESPDNITYNNEESESETAAEESLEAILDDISKPLSTV
jgi:hypothetical protein